MVVLGSLVCRPRKGRGGSPLLLALLAAACVLALAACGGKASDEEATEGPHEPVTYTSSQVAELLGSLRYGDADVAVSDGAPSLVQCGEGRVVVTREFEISSYEDVPQVLHDEAERCAALAGALVGNRVGADAHREPFVDVTWVVGDGHGNVYFALTDAAGTVRTANSTLGLLPQLGGYALSDSVYVAIGRGSSGIPPRSGAEPCALDGEPITVQSWLSIPDELWVTNLP